MTAYVDFEMRLDPITRVFTIIGAGFGHTGQLIVEGEVVPTKVWSDSYVTGDWPFDFGFSGLTIAITPTRN